MLFKTELFSGSSWACLLAKAQWRAPGSGGSTGGKTAAGLCAVWESEAKGELLISVGCWVLERRQDLFSSDCRPRPSQKGCLYTAHHITHAQTHTHALAAKIRGDIFIFCNDTPLTRCVIVHALVYTAGRTWSLTWKECPRWSANEEWLHVNGLPWQLTMDTLA